MWPFKKKREIPFADDLTDGELGWLDEQRDALNSMCASAGIPTPAPSRRLDAADELIRWWHRQPRDVRPDPNLIVNAAGVALGDALAAAGGLEWKVITDSFGTDLGLWWRLGKGHVILAPTHSVAKKFAENPDGFVAGLFKVMAPDVARLKQQISAG